MLTGNYDEIEPKDMLFKVPATDVFGQPTEFNLAVSTVGELAEKFISLKSAKRVEEKNGRG